MTMPSIRYYDYGTMRRDAERRVYDVQKTVRFERPARDEQPGASEQAERYRDEAREGRAAQYRETPECGCRATENIGCSPCDEGAAEPCSQSAGSSCPKRCGDCSPASSAKPFGGDELLILALLVIIMNDGGDLPIMLALLYLLL